MDERVLVEVYVPAVMRSYDVYLPLGKHIKEIKEILFPILEELSDGVFIPVVQTMLYKERTKSVLANENTLAQAGIVHGDRLFVL